MDEKKNDVLEREANDLREQEVIDMQYREDIMYYEKKGDSFEYAFAALIFASLAFSMQFSSSLGKKSIRLLVLSWLCYLIAGIISGIRLMWNYKISLKQPKLNLMKSTIFYASGKGLERATEAVSEKIKLIKKRTLFFRIQVIFFILALFFNFLFATINVLPVEKIKPIALYIVTKL